MTPRSHHPLQVLAGVLVGAFWAVLLVWAMLPAYAFQASQQAVLTRITAPTGLFMGSWRMFSGNRVGTPVITIDFYTEFGTKPLRTVEPYPLKARSYLSVDERIGETVQDNADARSQYIAYWCSRTPGAAKAVYKRVWYEVNIYHPNVRRQSDATEVTYPCNA